jgi:glycine/D-amino acid oxidase-like deaminating enzyme
LRSLRLGVFALSIVKSNITPHTHQVYVSITDQLRFLFTFRLVQQYIPRLRKPVKQLTLRWIAYHALQPCYGDNALTAGYFRYTVCAAGIFSRKLARMVGLNLPVRAIRESVAATVPMAPLTDLAIFGRDVCFRQIKNGQVFLSRTNLGSADFDVTLESFRNIRYFLPIFWKYKDLLRVHVGRPLWEDILRAMPWSETRLRPFDYAVDLEPEVNRKTIEACRQAFMAHFPALGDVALQETWAGVIDSTPDLLPVVGPVKNLPGIFFATGFSGHGFGLGPPMGYLLAEWLTEGKPSLDLRKLRFERFEERDFEDMGKIG